jgi:ribosomal protein S16
MVRIRLRRVGAKGQPSYRIIAADKEAPRDGRFLEILGFYNPRTDPSTIQVKEDRIFDWMSKGAQLSESASRCYVVLAPWNAMTASNRVRKLKFFFRKLVRLKQFGTSIQKRSVKPS